jgi:type II secretory pathway pseudopilin PulG
MAELIAPRGVPRILESRAGITLIETVVVLTIIGLVVGIGGTNLFSWLSAQEIKTSARAVSNAFALARSEAMRTGEIHIVTFGLNSLTNANDDIVIAADGTPATRDCSFASSDIVHRISLESSVAWGTTAGLAGNTAAPGDQGGASANIPLGSSFSLPSSSTPASWVAFEPDGIPRTFSSNGSACTSYGLPGEAVGAIYVTNGQRDYAVVLTALGTTRISVWREAISGWRT